MRRQSWSVAGEGCCHRGRRPEDRRRDGRHDPGPRAAVRRIDGVATVWWMLRRLFESFLRLEPGGFLLLEVAAELGAQGGEAGGLLGIGDIELVVMQRAVEDVDF